MQNFLILLIVFFRNAKSIINLTGFGRQFFATNPNISLSSNSAVEFYQEKPKDQKEPEIKRENMIFIENYFTMYPVGILKPSNRLHPLEGLWVAEYSIHGIELLHFSIRTQSELAQTTLDNRIQRDEALASYKTLPIRSPLKNPCNYQSDFWPPMKNGSSLVAHKFTGDCNVPADTDSFVIFIDQLENFSYPLK